MTDLTSMTNNDKALVRVQFRFILGDVKSPSTSRLFTNYSDKWSSLMNYVLALKDGRLYDDLPELRKLIKEDTTVADLIDCCDPIFKKVAMDKLVKAAPLFNIAPVDLKSFILATLGLKSYNVTLAEKVLVKTEVTELKPIHPFDQV